MKKINNPLPKNLEISIGLDVSTSTTGYALLLNGKPIILKTIGTSIGQVDMIEKGTPKEHTYGDKLCKYSSKARQTIRIVIFESLSAINKIIEELKLSKGNPPTIKRFDVVFEISEIPNFAKNQFGKQGQTITSIRKLALFTGAVATDISNIIENTTSLFNKEPNYKFIKPTEWQSRLWTKEEINKENVKSSTGRSLKVRGSKVVSVRRANTFLKKWGFDSIDYNLNDMADAINIATLANEVRDDVFAKSQAITKKQNITKKIPNRINYYESLLRIINRKLTNKFMEYSKNNIWFLKSDYEKLNPLDKRKYTSFKKLKKNYEEITQNNQTREAEAKVFLNKMDYTNFLTYTTKIKNYEEKLKQIKKEKVLNVKS